MMHKGTVVALPSNEETDCCRTIPLFLPITSMPKFNPGAHLKVKMQGADIPKTRLHCLHAAPRRLSCTSLLQFQITCALHIFSPGT